MSVVTHNGVRYLKTSRGIFPYHAEPHADGAGIPPALAASASAHAAPRAVQPPPRVDFDEMKKALDKSEETEANKEARDIQAELKKISDSLQSRPGAPKRSTR